MARKAEIRYVNFYTAGSAAYRFDPEPQPKKKVTLPKPRRQKKILVHLDPVVALEILVVAVLVVMMVVGLVQLVNAQQRANEMCNYVSMLQAENKDLDKVYRAGFDLEEIRQIATEMGMIPIEEAYTVHISVPTAEAVEEPSLWENICVFLAGLFA